MSGYDDKFSPSAPVHTPGASELNRADRSKLTVPADKGTPRKGYQHDAPAAAVRRDPARDPANRQKPR